MDRLASLDCMVNLRLCILCYYCVSDSNLRRIRFSILSGAAGTRNYMDRWEEEWFVYGYSCIFDISRGGYCFRATIQLSVDSMGKRFNPLNVLQLGSSSCQSGSSTI